MRRKRVSKKYNLFKDEAIKNVCRSMADDFIQENAEFRADSGLKTLIIRETTGKSCEWCNSLAGVYEYGDHPDDVFRRHDGCDCIITFKSEKGSFKGLWPKKKFDNEKGARLAAAEELKKRKLALLMNRKKKVRKLQPEPTSAGKGDIINKSAAKTEKYYARQTDNELLKGIRSEQKQITLHIDKIKNPEKYVPGYKSESKQYREGLIRKWKKDLANHERQVELRKKELKRRGVDYE